ncbi:CHAT domain-containing protein [Kordia periserrulae]|uniref:CHAT domain-containing protein n=1 Tax=Kordia periserrulae TaxID=701523 RepID=A0A2T6C1L6_9FLAO|nr:CHAT domain-containing protein [Kordia periserrulae]PTX62201.1 CHAT domain-containing protein [Kordia periserrulae]
MNLILRCIFIMFLCSSQHFLHAQESASTLLDTTEKLYTNGDYAASFASAEKTLGILQTNTSQLDSLQRAQLYFYKGASEYYLKRFDQSITSYNKAISLCPTSDAGLNYEAELYYERAFSEYELGQYIASHKSSKKAAVLMEQVQQPNYDYLVSIYADIAGTAASLGFIDDAKNHLSKAESIYQIHQKTIVKDPKEVSKPVLFAYKAVEIIDQKTVIFPKDIEFATEKIQALQKQQPFNAPEKRMYAVALNMLGDMHLRKVAVSLSDCQSAHKYLDKALQNLNKQQYASHVYQFQFNKVKAFSFEKKHTEALKLMNSLLKDLPENDARRSYFETKKADILLALDNKEQAIQSLEKAIKTIHKGTTALKKDFSNFVPSYDLNETGLLVEMADTIVQHYPKDPTILSLAAKMYKLGLIQFENCYREEVFNQKLTRYYQTAVGGMLKLKKLGYGHHGFKLNELLNRMEMIENRLAWNQFRQSRSLNASAVSDAILQQEQKLRKALVAAKRRKDTAAIFEYHKQLQLQLVTLKETFPEIALFAFEDFDIETIQKAMPTSKVIVKYKKIGAQLFAFTITQNAVDFYELEASEAILQTVENYYETISKQQENTKIAHDLYVALFPFDTSVFTEITVIPDDVLHYLPFEVLMTTQNKYLIEEAMMNYASHLVFVNQATFTNQTVKNEEIVVFTPSYNDALANSEALAMRNTNTRLIGAENESKLLASIFPSTLFESFLATKNNFIKHSRKAKIIHLAMHANIDNETPELSHLVFNENGTDTKMYVEELYGLHLNADLAVLSACNTGKGKLNAATGMVSMNRAFTLAGVPSTLSSLWEVPDKVTQTIMIDFYKYLKNGESKANALRKAKLNYLKNTDDANFTKPFYWAGFVLHGDAAPITLQAAEPSTSFVCVIAAILTLFIIIIVSFRIRKNTLKLF